MTEEELDKHVHNILTISKLEDPEEKLKVYLRTTIISQLEHLERWISQYKEEEL